MTTDIDDIEYSPLCKCITRRGRTARVEIFRLPGRTRWSLAACSDDTPSIVWSTDFASDREAYAEFRRRLDQEGMPSLLEEQV
jgi:hypothetical protein